MSDSRAEIEFDRRVRRALQAAWAEPPGPGAWPRLAGRLRAASADRPVGSVPQADQRKRRTRHPVRNPIAVLRLIWRLRRSLLLLAVLIAGPAGSIAAPSAAGCVYERTWQPAAVYRQIGASCMGDALADWRDAAPSSLPAHAFGWQIYEAALAQDGILGPHEGTTIEAAR